MKLRNVIWDNDTQTNRVVWFGSVGTRTDGTAIRKPNYVEWKRFDVDSIKEYKRIEIVNSLSVLRGELFTDRRLGVGLLQKTTKEILDIEILDLLRTNLRLIVNKFDSRQEGRNYILRFEVTTPEGVEVDINMDYNFVGT